MTHARRAHLRVLTGGSAADRLAAAQAIAREQRRELLRIDLSQLVSKHIGETEKKLSQVFVEAERTNAVLYFDEGDALFGKRSEVKDSHDRYANQEVNYLLQRIEAFEGLVIVASNLRQRADHPLVRRADNVIELPPRA